MRTKLLVIFLLLFHFSSFGAVILQYHHVSDTTPKSTSITPEQFAVHLKYLQENSFNVIPLSQLINDIKNQQPLKDKTVAITFDDAYIDIYTNAKPLLDEYNYPYTIYVNPSIINDNESKKNSHYLSWAQLRALGDDGVIIANHGFEHDSLTRITGNLSQHQW
jgi:peptidoglycan/xylan/chitin deacetylase (PgdA/CDA1 family)